MRLTSIPRIKSINLSQKRFERRRRLYARKIHWELFGGPLGVAWLCTPGTLKFSIPGWSGYYDGENKWVEA
ncbi:hypothetical protein [Pseudomonas aeruginosa]|uniref:hypothetical protein n=1 Tax=Pseudomonas aeruginosa TaxID=287 RepID=UPI00053CEFB3|nr:hypothetical protein [Pseudomonas aeruginosa]QBI79972.1 hypothetical protein [Pseudomonas phage vB_Pae_CF23a]QBI80060.1 hypothetical protein [Pseudomonas phage vB_Pae_CF57a]QBI80149.1 hypothetical protein [Pseudomonas phage vB_Pae_CF65a]QBI80286.1 hypothetical protein [Pseudomonas phage vB_Pae_CF81a]QBI80373.1 hypothetical protein [Pseudomonas phage vB_Pae_CF118a]QBI80441.1 hypothetical protein [Pseudomonas phage vB_Pae_CF121b]QBI80623.1 hypothetical protein [Pseudomonas phage vB_Pae_CF17